MKSPSKNQTTESAGCLSKSAGCLVSVLLFPFFITIFGWFAFSIGPMSCAYPSKCSQLEENAKGILSIVILIGGGWGIPIVTGILA
ncbi:hypothetical protein MEN41_21755 [Dolichospermum sp. ST_con]|nr:hypothetical protein [Dolichospermum sp. ST_con]MDD1422790.1 hypothetical protein [Dolichospermum sp. ST_sed1]MDD1434725.1 hypothetical protein [Dolichospermum sp. ST_sed6]MDD1449561.1 hypothetical protein [Dolichospermum sp. ST_sed8]MDD1463531.1 hypothetical protein [Dolichospermum sp. ST_sed2]MDD1474812.1 hypothetical protein [Dolichospermum sp. ST_sed4]